VNEYCKRSSSADSDNASQSSSSFYHLFPSYFSNIRYFNTFLYLITSFLLIPDKNLLLTSFQDKIFAWLLPSSASSSSSSSTSFSSNTHLSSSFSSFFTCPLFLTTHTIKSAKFRTVTEEDPFVTIRRNIYHIDEEEKKKNKLTGEDYYQNLNDSSVTENYVKDNPLEGRERGFFVICINVFFFSENSTSSAEEII
jgi:hypothetical protein